MGEGVGPCPTSLVNADGSVSFGVYNTPARRVGLEDAVWTAHGFRVPAPLRSLRLKRWHHILVVHPELLLTAAMVDARYTKVTWVQAIDLRTGERFEHHHQSPRLDVKLPDALFDARAHCARPGYRIDVRDHLDAESHRWRFDIAAGKSAPGIAGELHLLHARSGTETVSPLVVALPLGDERAMYSHKVPLPVEGQLRVGERTYELHPESSTAVLDIHQAHYPHHTWWRWATFAGFDAQGRRVALNLTDNIVTSDDLNENAVWCDGQVERLGKALFHRVDAAGDAPAHWQVGTKDSRVQLRFTHEGARSEDLNLGIVRSRFQQSYGRFSGVVTIAGVATEIDGAYGLLEDHDSKW